MQQGIFFDIHLIFQKMSRSKRTIMKNTLQHPDKNRYKKKVHPKIHE